MNDKLSTKEKAMEVTKEIIVASLQSNENCALTYAKTAEELSKSIEIIFNKVLALIKG